MQPRTEQPDYRDRICAGCEKLIGYSRYPIHTLCLDCARPVDKRKGERLYCKVCAKWFGVSCYPMPLKKEEICEDCG